MLQYPKPWDGVVSRTQDKAAYTLQSAGRTRGTAHFASAQPQQPIGWGRDRFVMWHELLSLQVGAESFAAATITTATTYSCMESSGKLCTLSARLWESKQHLAALREVADYQGAVPSVPCQI